MSDIESAKELQDAATKAKRQPRAKETEEAPKGLVQVINEIMFGPIVEKKTPWLRNFFTGALFAVAFWAIGLGIYERNPKHRAEAIAFYVGAGALVGAFLLTPVRKIGR